MHAWIIFQLKLKNKIEFLCIHLCILIFKTKNKVLYLHSQKNQKSIMKNEVLCMHSHLIKNKKYAFSYHHSFN